MIDIEQALNSPATVFATPEEVVANADLDRAQRVAILRQWSYDLRELLVASDENMAANSDGDVSAQLLTRVDALLGELEAGNDDRPAPTMQGGV